MSQHRRRSVSILAAVGLTLGSATAVLIAGSAGASQAPPGTGGGTVKTFHFPAKATLDLRVAPYLGAKVKKANAYKKGSKVPVVCQIKGGSAYGSSIWDRVPTGGYVTDAYVRTGSDGYAKGVPRCAEHFVIPDPKPTPKPKPKPALKKNQFRVTADLDGRATKALNGKRVKTYKNGSVVTLSCQTSGPAAYGSTIWDFTSDKLWVPDRYVKTGSSGYAAGVPRCATSKPKPTPKPTPKPKPTTVRVVAMGDSFGSGEGSPVPVVEYPEPTNNPVTKYYYDSGTDTAADQCHRSKLSWQRNVTLPGGLGTANEDNRKLDYHQVACSGAIIDNLFSVSRSGERPQTQVLNGQERYILLSIGGNDLHFADIIDYCVRADWEFLPSCRDLPAVKALPANITALQSRLYNTLTTIHGTSPHATIVLAGYPELIRGIGCAGIGPLEGATLDAASRLLRTKTAATIAGLRARGIDVRYADTVAAFEQGFHGACSGYLVQWLNSPTNIGRVGKNGLFHPNPDGQRAYTRAVNGVLGT